MNEITSSAASVRSPRQSNRRLLRGLRVAGGALLFGGLASFSACTTPATEIVAGMTTQIQVPKDLAAVGVVVRYGGQQVSCRTYPLVDGTVTLPSTLGMVPQEARKGQVLEPVTITVLGFRTSEQGQAFDDTCVAAIPGGDDPQVVVIRSKRLPYIDDRILYLPMPLRESCSGVACPEDQTCVGGLCEDNAVDSETLVDYKDTLVFGNTNTCFSAKYCLPNALTQAAILKDAETCTFRYPVIPDGPELDIQPGHMNVEIVYSSFGTEILDLDDKEGFILPNPDDPLTFQLAPNLCESNYKKGKILAVRAAPACLAKPPLQPICETDMADIQAGGRAPLQENADELCTLGDPLVPSESALYVLLDRSQSMADVYGGDIQVAVGIPLRNPIAARTSVALSFLPSDTCDPTEYESPDFGFDDVDKVRDPIGQALADTGTLLPDDPALNLDAAMQGAYDALEALTPSTDTSVFNRRAVIVVGNHDFGGFCGPTAPDALAQAEKDNENIYTYVAVLKPSEGSTADPDAQAEGAAIATAGGTEVFDAIAKESDGALAVQKVLNDLGSCLYDPPASDSVKTNATHLSYVNPITLERADIARNDACDSEAAALTESGWGVDASGGIRICGAPCDELRDTLTDVATVFAALGEPAPQVPVVTSIPCEDPSRFVIDPIQ